MDALADKLHKLWPEGIAPEDYYLVSALATRFRGESHVPVTRASSAPTTTPKKATPVAKKQLAKKKAHVGKSLTVSAHEPIFGAPTALTELGPTESRPGLDELVANELSRKSPQTAIALARNLLSTPPSVHNALKKIGAVAVGTEGEGKLASTLYSLPGA